ncbi:aminoglycoside phosphotransferase [Podospora aff. communis PSN243]|uniref:Aminoglycoside phosphotransferase n=1 Tax=Podospora aff. communis PSN243 TaxID=3040156 RepID=A0AAV9H2P9_9PEZI|nr:aminoglycoside phosphotransferase [Podospora aff. communis PSN243]
MPAKDDHAAALALAAGLTDLRLAGDGLEFTVYRAKSPQYAPHDVALRIPKCDIFSNVNDPHLSAKELLQQELAIYTLLEPSAVPVPRPFELLQVGDKAAMLSEYVDSDGSAPSPEVLGQALAQLHLVALPAGFTTVACEGTDILAVLPRRITQRLTEFRKFDSVLPSTLSEDMLRCVIADLKRFPSSLLHMDWRPANLRTVGGEIVAVVDFSNALVGPAAVDIFRVLELLQPGPDFLEAYASIGSLPELSLAEELCLRLDAAVMIALVFLSESPDAELAPARCSRVRELYRGLVELLKPRPPLDGNRSAGDHSHFV